MEGKTKRVFKKELAVLTISIVVMIILLELSVGYYFYHKQHNDSAISAGLKSTFLKNILSKSNDLRAVSVIHSEENPFVATDAKQGFQHQKLHPLIDYTNAYGKYSDQNITLDYFGFRNDEDLYFFEKRDYILIVITGGSEAAGFSHRTTIAKNLEIELNQRSKSKFKVLNLAMNGYTLSNEINSYVNLAYHLRPEFVITHSGWNNLFTGLMIPYNFKKIGFIYFPKMEEWPPRLYDLRPSEELGLRLNERGIELLVDSYLQGIDKYHTIVKGNGGQFIVGVQGYNPNIRDDSLLMYQKVVPLFDDLVIKAQENGYLVFRNNPTITYVDSVHSTEEASKIIAHEYAQVILAKLSKENRTVLPAFNTSVDQTANLPSPLTLPSSPLLS